MLTSREKWPYAARAPGQPELGRLSPRFGKPRVVAHRLARCDRAVVIRTTDTTIISCTSDRFAHSSRFDTIRMVAVQRTGPLPGLFNPSSTSRRP
jgi:hypothetical protein